MEEEDESSNQEVFLSNFLLARFMNHYIEIQIDNPLNEAMSNSMESYHNELFQKKDECFLNHPSEVYTDEDPIICFICLQNIMKNETIYRLECSHHFHKSCLDTAVSHQHKECPLCRKPLPLKTYVVNEEGHKIFYE